MNVYLRICARGIGTVINQGKNRELLPRPYQDSKQETGCNGLNRCLEIETSTYVQVLSGLNEPRAKQLSSFKLSTVTKIHQ
ncbi:hypothetical protein PoMZ_10381 [Pyricularia oryzae]|uniref:Uncharacterized protein n=1 Tax=Pyricularia oryzae TaxID=318829 RepID=A0A4P7N025_PYROR|nr:hypothetical protein PoMZ_10381 [Pyricularia oryzae]